MASPHAAQHVAPSSAGSDMPSEIEVEDDHGFNFDFDTDSTLGDDTVSMTTTLKSSMRTFIHENGRRYHSLNDGSYFLPNDDDELDRLDMHHHMLTLLTDRKLHLAPLDAHPHRILDLGTGTGIWAIEMGEKYPSALVLGNDLSPVQPEMVPANVSFEVDDIEAEWVFSSPFDYIHARYLAGAISDWPRLVSQAYDNLAPGGWIELQDFTMNWYTATGEFRPGCAMDQWTSEIIAAITTIGREPEPGPKLEGWVRDAGFVNVHHEVRAIPTGTWAKDPRLKEIGAFDLMSFLEGLEGMTLRVLTTIRGWSVEQVQVFLAEVRKDLKNPRLQAQHNFHIVYAQKPEAEH